MCHSFWAILLSLSVLSAAIWDSGRKISVPIWVFDGENISVYPWYPCNLHWESPHPQSICVITHLSPVSGLTNLYWRRVIFDPQRHQKLGFWKWLEVSSWEVDQLRSHWCFPGVELGWGEFKVSGLQCLSLKRVCRRFRELVPCSEEHVMMWQC